MTEPAHQSDTQRGGRLGTAALRAEPGFRRSGHARGIPSIPVTPRPWLQYLAKRSLDFLVATVTLVLALPLFVAIALLIKLDSPGPVFFLQERVGRGGRLFRLIKFRTMYHGASDHVHREFVRRQLTEAGMPAPQRNGNGNGAPMYKLVFDERVTRVGRVLRRTSLDELPQALNVLLGDMSVVGPRPPLTYELDDYEPWQFERLSVIPGITGLWQVSGRNLLSYRRMCEIDAEYVRGWSLWGDLKILAKTVPVVLFHTGWTA